MEEEQRRCLLDEFVFDLNIEGWADNLLIKRKKETML